MSFKGDTSTLSRFAAKLRELPRVLANRVARVAADKLTDVAQSTISAGENAFGAPWAPGSEGQKVTLRASGAMLDNVRYVAIGTKIRAALTTKYAKYQVGKRPLFPTQGGPLPAAYQRALEAAVGEALEGEVLA